MSRADMLACTHGIEKGSDRTPAENPGETPATPTREGPMPRKTSPIEDVLVLLAKFPWWVSVLLGIGSYVILHRIAEAPLVLTGALGQQGSALTQTVGKGLATAGQYVVPIVCLAAAALSAWQRHQRRALVAGATGNAASALIAGLSWQQFERLVGEGFREQGYQVVETGGGGADGGIDLVLKKGHETFLVQCKHWRAFKVGVDVVRALYGVMAARGAAGGFVVTSGRFTNDATAFAAGRNVSLIDGPGLQTLLKRAEAGRAQSPAQTDDPSAPKEPALACPLCGQPMVKRGVKKGAAVGTFFWGCTAFPDCRGTRSVG